MKTNTTTNSSSISGTSASFNGSSNSAKLQLNRLTELIGVSPWTLRFHDADLHEAYLRNCLDRRVYSGSKAKCLCLISGICYTAQTFINYMAFTAYNSTMTKEEIDSASFISIPLYLTAFSFYLIPLIVPGSLQNHRHFGKFSILCLFIAQVFHQFIWEIYFIATIRVPSFFPDYPFTVVITLSCQAILCTIESDFLHLLCIPVGVFLLRCISFTCLLAYRWEVMYVFFSTSWFTLIADLPILFSSLAACTLLSYWLNLFARLRFCLYHFNEEKSMQKLKTPFWKSYLQSQKSIGFSDYSARSVVLLFKTSTIPMFIMFCFNLVPNQALSTVQKICSAFGYFGLLAFLIWFHRKCFKSNIDSFLRGILINVSAIFAAVLFHGPFLFSTKYQPNTSSLINSYLDTAKTSVMLRLTITSLAGIQSRVILLYIIVMGLILIIELINFPQTSADADLSEAWYFLVLYLAASQIFIMTAVILEMQLYGVYKVISSSISQKLTQMTHQFKSRVALVGDVRRVAPK